MSGTETKEECNFQDIKLLGISDKNNVGNIYNETIGSYYIGIVDGKNQLLNNYPIYQLMFFVLLFHSL
jgi:hypothetical protein